MVAAAAVVAKKEDGRTRSVRSPKVLALLCYGVEYWYLVLTSLTPPHVKQHCLCSGSKILSWIIFL